MNADLLAALKDLEGSVVTRVEATRHRTTISLSGEGTTVVKLIACEWADERCESCNCPDDRIWIEVVA
jgi:hypothetical protein